MAKGLAEVLRFGRYEPLFRIGVGGMAEVYAARIRGEAGFQKLVAVKRMLPHLSGDQRFVDMFLDEARLAANITSPHVVQTLDLGRTDDDALYIVMELIVGITLASVMRSKAHLDPPVALDLLAQAAQGLDDAHEARAPSGVSLQLVHRDVSPQNILIGVDGRAKVSDFGIAHAMTQRRTHTRVGEVKGKFSYFSPEQAAGRAVDRRSDVFSLGIVAWELLTGRRLFKGKPAESLAAVREKPIPPLLELRPDLGPDVSRAVMTALERDPDRRHATAGQLATSLRRAGLYFGEQPSPRVVGTLVAEVGGDSLARIQERLSSAGAPESVTGTVILPEHAVPQSGTQSLNTDDLLEGDATVAERDDTVAGREEPTAAERPSAAAGGASAAEPTRPAVPDLAPPGPAVPDLAPTAIVDATPLTPADIPQRHSPVVIVERGGVRPWMVVAVVAALLAVGVGGALAWMATEGGDGDGGAPEAAEAAAPARVAEPASPNPGAPTDPATVEPAGSGTGEAEPRGGEGRDEPPGADDEEGAVAAEAPGGAQAPDETAEAAADTEEPSAAERRRAERRARRAARRRAERRRTSGTTSAAEQGAAMDSPLPGLDAFDRAVQR